MKEGCVAIVREQVPKIFLFEFLKKLGQGIQYYAEELHKLFKVLATVKCACEQ